MSVASEWQDARARENGSRRPSKTTRGTFKQLLIAYGECCPGGANNYNRRQGTFPLMQFISEVSVEGGKQVQRAFKMMWEREYIEEAQKTYMGNLTTEEAKRQWEEWKANPKHPHDNDGPRGFLRLEVPTGDYHKYYQAGPGSPGRPSGLNLIARPRPPGPICVANQLQSAVGVAESERPRGPMRPPPPPRLVFSPPRAPQDVKHSQRVALKDRDKKNATAADVTQAMKRAQGQLGNFGDATGTFDDLMGNLELGTASALSQSDRSNWWKGAFGEAGLAAPNVEDVYQNLAAAAQKKKANKSAAKPDGSEDDEEDEADDTEEEAENSQGNRNDNQNNTLNDVARNKATRSAQSSVADLKQQMNLMLTKGRAAAAELEADSDAMRFKAEVAVLNWRLKASRVVMNVEDKEMADARLQLAETKQQIGSQHPGSSGAQSEEAASSAGTSTAEANAALVKAAPSPSFLQIKVFADFEEMVNEVQASKTKDELKEAQAAMRSAKSHLSSLVSSLQAAIQDAYLARKLHRTRKEGPSKQEEKRRQQVEASMAGEERARKKAKPVEFSIFNADHPEDLDMPMFTVPELREFLTSASSEDVLALFSNPFIMKNAGWLGARPIAPTPGGAPNSREAAALSPPVPPVQWVANLEAELQHFRVLFSTSSQKASGGRAALPIKDANAIQELANLAQGAFPVGWMRTQLQPDLPPDLFEQLAPSFLRVARKFEAHFLREVLPGQSAVGHLGRHAAGHPEPVHGCGPVRP